jgi:hypothetical protein
MKIRVPQVIDILCDEHVSVNTSRSIWLPSQGVQYQGDRVIRGKFTRDGERFSGVSVAPANSTYFAEFSEALSNQIAVGNCGRTDGSGDLDTGLFKPLMQSTGADSK